MTTVSIKGNYFCINGTPTYSSRTFEGAKVEGLLFNVRAVQATFDDAHVPTRGLWEYPDTGIWDPERNCNEFIDILPLWKAHGILGFTIGFQGGGARYVPEVYDSYDNNAFTPDGNVIPAYADRISRVLAAADENGMVVIVSFFYWKLACKMNGEKALLRAIENACLLLESTGRKNFLVEIANENDAHFISSIFEKNQCHRTIAAVKERYPHWLVSTSLAGVNPQTGNGMPTPELVETADFVLLHGNGSRPPALSAALDTVAAMPSMIRNPKPIIINEDSTGMPNFETAWRQYVSWGYYDQGYNGESRIHDIWVPDQGEHEREKRYEDLSGFQTPPVNWGINTPRKKDFFSRVAQITGFPGSGKRNERSGAQDADDFFHRG